MDVLEEILDSRRAEVARAKKERSVSSLEKDLKASPEPHDLFDALNRPGKVSIIAEMKKKSPSAGLIREKYNVSEIAQAYERGGAKALSVLTEPTRFGGSLHDIQAVRKVTGLPILRKDFIFDTYQILEARVFGADAVLLIADMLDKNQIKDLAQAAEDLGIEALVEIFTEQAVEPALNTGARVIGINTRNLRTLEMAPNNVQKLRKYLPSDKLIVAESGISSPSDIRALRAEKIGAALIGESLMKKADLEKALKELTGVGG